MWSSITIQPVPFHTTTRDIDVVVDGVPDLLAGIESDDDERSMPVESTGEGPTTEDGDRVSAEPGDDAPN